MNKCIECGREIKETNSNFYLDNLCQSCEYYIDYLKQEKSTVNCTKDWWDEEEEDIEAWDEEDEDRRKF